ncbi:hypothetical protein [Actinacidiphila sp. bgisy167]|uniref:hypothetical protein n=1 Tax=Actinacidiphila sp. bgisy167 TaxID=3413797 RepID=UPI003D70ECEE
MGTLSVIGLVLGLVAVAYCVRSAFLAKTPAGRVGWIIAAPAAVLAGVYLVGYILVTALVLAAVWFTAAHFLR